MHFVLGATCTYTQRAGGSRWADWRSLVDLERCVAPEAWVLLSLATDTGLYWYVVLPSYLVMKTDQNLSVSSLKPADECCYMWTEYSCFSALRVSKISAMCKHCERKISYPICFPLTNISSITCLTLSLSDGIKNRSLQRSPHLFIDSLWNLQP